MQYYTVKTPYFLSILSKRKISIQKVATGQLKFIDLNLWDQSSWIIIQACGVGFDV